MRRSKEQVSLPIPVPTDQESAQLLLQSQLLLAVSRSEDIDKGNIEGSLKSLTEIAAVGLNVGRSSVWLYNENKDAIVCVDLYESATDTHSSGTELKAKDFPAYFKYLKEERTLPAHDAHTDPSTFEFSEIYLKPLNIFSMLDAPIRKNGEVIGVICNEAVGAKHHWSLTEQAFAGSVADIISRAFIAKDRTMALQKLQEMNENLERLVEERTRELEQQRASAFQSAKMASLGEMSAGIAHEINTPLASIQLISGAITRMCDENDLNPHFVRKYSVKIEETTQRIAAIIQSLRTFARDGTNDPFQVVNVKSLVTDTLVLCRERLHLSSIDVRLDGVADDIRIECRPVQIQQVLLNLIGNSFDAIHDNPNEKWIEFKTHRLGSDRLILSVIDSGPGIPPELRKKIMQPFFTTKEIGKGTGLGLSVSSGLVAAHNGSLSLDASCSNTCFHIDLPIRQPKEAEVRSHVKKAA